MRGIKGVAAAVALAAMTGQGLAASYLCIEDAATGFNWENDAWVQSNYFTSTYIVRTVQADEEIGEFCRAMIASEGPQPNQRTACYALHVMGEPVTSANVTLCNEYPPSGKDITLVRCDAAFVPYEFRTNGEFIIKRVNGGLNAPVDGGRDSLAIGVGKCSLVTP